MIPGEFEAFLRSGRFWNGSTINCCSTPDGFTESGGRIRVRRRISPIRFYEIETKKSTKIWPAGRTIRGEIPGASQNFFYIGSTRQSDLRDATNQKRFALKTIVSKRLVRLWRMPKTRHDDKKKDTYSVVTLLFVKASTTQSRVRRFPKTFFPKLRTVLIR